MMRLVRFRAMTGIFWGEFEPDGITPLIGDPFGQYRRDNQQYQHRDVQLLAPVAPTKIICVGHNYHEHIAESATATQAPDEPLIFLKPPSAVIGPGQTIILPDESERVDYEGELAVVIGKSGRNIDEIEAEDYIFGLTCANDVTARDFQQKDKQWARAKGFDTFCPIGPWVCAGLDFQDLTLETLVNLEVRQRSITDAMIFKVPELISFVSSIMTLNAGDVILTGTPSGVGPLSDGQQVEVRIQGIGSLVNDVRAESRSEE